MSNSIEVTVPDLGGATEVEVIELLVSVGDHVNIEDPLVSLETDKATVDVPSPYEGTVESWHVGLGDKVAEATLLLTLQSIVDSASSTSEPGEDPTDSPEPAAVEDTVPEAIPHDEIIHAEVVVLGSGPGGYTAAFRAADLGLDVVLVERYSTLGGVCLNVGCIPSKALLHAADVIASARHMETHGVKFGKPRIDLDTLRGWKDSVVGKLTQGLSGMASQRKITVVQGEAAFLSDQALSVTGAEGVKTLSFDKAIIAAGSRVTVLPALELDDPRVIDSAGALELPEIPKRMLIIGGGIIGLEMATVYSELGTDVSIVELTDQLIPGADKDIVKPLDKRIREICDEVYLGCMVTGLKSLKGGVKVFFEGGTAPAHATYDYVLVAVGRRPNGDLIDAHNAGISVDDRGFIRVDEQQRTNVPHIFAIGDIVGQPMLAHKATHEGKVAAEVCAGQKSAFQATVIPAVAYTDPEVAWAGLTEIDAKRDGVPYEKATFPWGASGRALGLDRPEGLTKLLFDPDTKRVVGAGIVGVGAGDLISEVALAIEMGADAEDIGLTIHPHPTLSETVAMAAEMFEGTITDLYIPKKK
jgi:dihydrolipoamide dehydrogenase